VRHFAYPYGSKSQRDKTLARGRYRLALGTRPALVASDADRADLPRVDCHDSRIALRLGLASGFGAAPYFTLRRTLRRVRRALSQEA